MIHCYPFFNGHFRNSSQLDCNQKLIELNIITLFTIPLSINAYIFVEALLSSTEHNSLAIDLCYSFGGCVLYV